jgi:hypothetical protein
MCPCPPSSCRVPLELPSTAGHRSSMRKRHHATDFAISTLHHPLGECHHPSGSLTARTHLGEALPVDLVDQEATSEPHRSRHHGCVVHSEHHGRVHVVPPAWADRPISPLGQLAVTTVGPDRQNRAMGQMRPMHSYLLFSFFSEFKIPEMCLGF